MVLDLFKAFKGNAGSVAFRAEVGQAKDATEMTLLLIKALRTEFSTIAKELSLTNETNETIVRLIGIFDDIDRRTLSRTTNNIKAINDMQDTATHLHDAFIKQVSAFMNKSQTVSDPLQRENLIQNLMKDCDAIITNAFPGISRDISAKQISAKPEETPGAKPGF